MALWHGKSRRKSSGGILKLSRKKRKYEIGREKRETGLGEHKTQVFRVRGNNQKIRVLRAGVANVMTKSKKAQKSKIIAVLENRANPHYMRRNIITKGAVIQTELGKALVTSRPGQHGVINCVLLE
ncbi:MAG: 30S ribosomal protein S8e [Candidatus Thermoplasmatota archaeon]|nr:30S ribosomal protein S8e [Candidatus Thermoplasmatota archaeon]MDI6855233.1 30S ribosomal protein S8e [Candidatus Thermoplasmatota archaeon]